MGLGGAQQVVVNYLRDFAVDEDIDFILAVYSKKDKSKYNTIVDKEHLNVIYLNNPSSIIKIPYVKRYFKKRIARKEWTSFIEEIKPDIVHVHLSVYLEVVLDPILKNAIPVRFDTLHSNPYRYHGNRLRYIKRAFKSGFVAICVTHEQVSEAKSYYNTDKCEIIHNGVDINDIRNKMKKKEEARKVLGIPNDIFVVVAVGRLHPIKRYDYLLSVFAEVLKRDPRSVLVFVGDGQHRRYLEKIASKKGLTRNVRFDGFCENVVDYYCAADVLAVTSESESSCLTLLEAQVCKLRCVISYGVPTESIVECNVTKMKQESTISEWADALLNKSTDYIVPQFSLSDYEVHLMSKKLKEIYIKYYNMYSKEKNNHEH